MEILKELNRVDVWTLLVAIATLVVSISAYVYSRKSDKRRISSEIARKEAILHQMDDRFTTRGVDHTVWDNLRVQKMLLQAEIEQLKKEV
jgi:hypothetical protein